MAGKKRSYTIYGHGCRSPTEESLTKRARPGIPQTDSKISLEQQVQLLSAELVRLSNVLHEAGISYRPAFIKAIGGQPGDTALADASQIDIPALYTPPTNVTRTKTQNRTAAGESIDSDQNIVESGPMITIGRDSGTSSLGTEIEPLTSNTDSRNYGSRSQQHTSKSTQEKEQHATKAFEKSSRTGIACKVNTKVDKSSKSKNHRAVSDCVNHFQYTGTPATNAAQKVQYLSCFRKLPATAPWNHAHLILDAKSEPRANLELPDLDCYLPDLLVSAIHKHSAEALYAFLDVEKNEEFWFICRMQTTSPIYSWSLCRRGHIVQVALHRGYPLLKPPVNVEYRSLRWSVDNIKHNFVASMKLRYKAANRPWTFIPDHFAWTCKISPDKENTGFKSTRTRERHNLRDRQASFLYKHILLHTFVKDEFKSLEADWGEKLLFDSSEPYRVRGCFLHESGFCRFGDSILEREYEDDEVSSEEEHSDRTDLDTEYYTEGTDTGSEASSGNSD